MNKYLRPEPLLESQSTKSLTLFTFSKAPQSSSPTLFLQQHPWHQDNFFISPRSLSDQRRFIWDSLQSQCPDKTIDTQSIPLQNSAWERELCFIDKRFITLIARKSMDLRCGKVLQIQLTSEVLECGGSAIYFLQTLPFPDCFGWVLWRVSRLIGPCSLESSSDGWFLCLGYRFKVLNWVSTGGWSRGVVLGFWSRGGGFERCRGCRGRGCGWMREVGMWGLIRKYLGVGRGAQMRSLRKWSVLT